jgi:hypothetical protein
MGDSPAIDVARLDTMTTSRLAARNTSGLFVRAAWRKICGRKIRPSTSMTAMVTPPLNKVLANSVHAPSGLVAIDGASAPSMKMIGTSAKSSNNSMEKAARPTALWVPTIGSTTAVDDRASARPRPKAPAADCPNA